MEQKYIFFCDQRSLVLRSGISQTELSEGFVHRSALNSSELLDLIHQWINKHINSDLCILAADEIGDISSLIKQRYPEIPAAGGLVFNAQKEVLFIYRSGYWDLPKGHVEKGESFDFTAIREVVEETGLTQISIQHELFPTRHFYFMKGRWQIKLTQWYLMHSPLDGPLFPQLSEGIEKAEWVDYWRLPDILMHSYRSVRESLGEAIVSQMKH
jgi:8-oxo-dGTP pyrophosphatase MutT (NUDIX family)